MHNCILPDYKKLLFFILLLLGLSLIALASNTYADETPIEKGKPNIIFILTDDASKSVFNKKTMPNTFKYLKTQGTIFNNQVIPTATCCPSRSVFLSGQYGHNNGVLANGGTYGGFDGYYRPKRGEGFSKGYNIGSFLQNGGYKTALIGKYLNTYGNDYKDNVPGTSPEVVPGWDKWFVSLRNRSQKFYNYYIRFNDDLENFYSGYSPYDLSKKNTEDFTVDSFNKVAYYKAPKCKKLPCSRNIRKRIQSTYSERIYVNQAIDFLRKQQVTNGQDEKPAFVWYATDTPHGTGDNTLPQHKKKSWGGPSYNPRDFNKFKKINISGSPNFDEKDISDKIDSIRKLPNVSLSIKSKIKSHKQSRMRAMFSLDRELNRLYEYLDSTGKSKNTVIVFTSDNGYNAGEHRLIRGKMTPYREVTEFPVLFKGPGIRKGVAINSEIAGTIDFVPTIIDLAGLDSSVVADPESGLNAGLDGISLKPLLAGSSNIIERGGVLLESVLSGGYSVPGFQLYNGIRTRNYVYLRYRRALQEDISLDCINSVSTKCAQKGYEEFYDLSTDPYQMNNLASSIVPLSDKQTILNELEYHRKLLDRMKDCIGIDCRY